MISLTDLTHVPGAENAYLVGGCVRDALLGRRPEDYDIAASPPIRIFAENLRERIGGHAVPLGPPGRRIIRIISDSATVDISPINGPTIETDLRKRDFTVNAIARNISSGQIFDCTGGLEDLRRKTIRMVSARSFVDDPVRLVRAYRLAALLGFTIDFETAAAIRMHTPLIRQAAGERIRTDLLKLLAIDTAYPWMKKMAENNLLFALIPELAALKGCRQNRHHSYDVWDHTLQVFAHIEKILSAKEVFLSPGPLDPLKRPVKRPAKPKRPVNPPATLPENDLPVLLKISALLHDVGKPATRKATETGEASFHGHERTGAEICESICRRLRFSSREARIICQIIRHHLSPLQLFMLAKKDKDPVNGMPGRPVIRFFMRCGNLAPPVLVLGLADHRGKHRPESLPEEDAFTRFVKRLLLRYTTDFRQKAVQKPLVTGNDLIEKFGLTPGPQFSSILKCVEEARLSGGAVTRAEGMKVVEDYLKRHIV